ncbi:hypothetical protein ACSRUE_17725 [Sorangium sp. KYC3313]|uniref:hypothetical protein n=1 Tax=Sorangium sp. KYC3313 TaxID=3449740 RepID=UPI003F8B2068
MRASAVEQPFFSRVAEQTTATLYERQAAPGAGGWFAFVAFAAPPQPEALSFAGSWSSYLGDPRRGENGGLYVVAASRPADPAAYLAAFLHVVQTLNTQTGNFAYRYLFIGDPTSGDPTAYPGVIPFFTTSPDPSQPGQITSATTVAARNVGLVFAQGVRVYGDVGTSSLRLASYGGALISLLSSKYTPKNITTLTSDVIFPLDGAAAGAFGFGVTLLSSNVPANDDFTLLDVGLKYFTERGGRILSQRYPVFGPTVDGSPVPFKVSFDPLRPLAHGRTAFTFAGDGSTCAPMQSALRDTFVHGVNLVPTAGAAALVLQRDTVAVASPGGPQQDFYYLVPSGPFALAAGDSQPPATRVMCGLSPTENVIFDPPGSVITFHPDQPAFSPLLANAPAAQGAPRLTDRYVTAWATITAKVGAAPGPAPTYLAQPQGSALFASGGSPTTYLEHREVPACVLTDASADASFPMVGYGAVVFGAHHDTFSQGDVSRLESDVLSVERRARLTAHGRLPTRESAARPQGDTPPHATTPQGFVVDLATDGSGAWKRLHLAQTSWSPDPAKVPRAVMTLAFDDVDDTLRAAFQTNQQLLVVTQPRVPWTLDGAAGAAGTVFESVLAPQGWPFDLRVGEGSNPGDFRNVLIFKFCDGSLDSRIDDAARWTAAAEFNADPDSVAAWLRAYVEEAKQLARGPDGAYFQRFVDAVKNDAWRGILALRVNVDASALPQELRGLVAGIDLTQLDAHHIGVDISFVDTSGGGFKPDGNSSVFATVYYVDPVYAGNLAAGASPDLPIPVAAQVDYAFRVLTLKALFVNAEIAAFSSKSQITLNRVFGEQVGALALDGVVAPSHSVVLDGQYQSHDGVGTYVFQTNAKARFLLVSNLWRGFETDRASFATLRAPATGTVLSRFTFAGYLDFAVLSTSDGQTSAPFDLLSFGGEGAGDDPRGSGLPFSGLHLDMTFDTAAPGSPSFAFVIDQMTFAPTAQQARAASLYARMPLTLAGITSGAGTPRDLGYLAVNVPSLPADPLGDAWYGLVYTLDLGTAGALAAKVGFTARLLVAWGPGSAAPSFRVSVGLALPGTGAGNTGALSLQGVLKLTIDRILLYRDPVSATFVLRLMNVALSLLGVSLPPGTTTAFIVYGNPAPGQRDVVGWYAAVNREKKPELLAPTGER